MKIAKLILIGVFAVGVAAAMGQGLGPRDGSDLPPTDLERVGVGTQAPDFTLVSKDGKAVTLSSFEGKKDVILVFYRGYW